jgi:signal transduction histidine kinase
LGKAKHQDVPINIEETIVGAIQTKAKDLAAESVFVRTDFGAISPVIQGDHVLLQQAFINIIGNAIHAMETTDSCSREILISTMDDNGSLLISIADTGAGIQIDQSSLFRAFSTTKVAGMGLGLAVCKSVVSAHRGTISLRDRIGETGAVVEIRLPVTTRRRPKSSLESFIQNG